MESRFTPSAQISRTMGAVRLSGFASIVHSTSGSRCIDIDSAERSIESRPIPIWLGVPPPRYTVSMAPSFPSLEARRISITSDSTYSSIIGESRSTAEVAKSQYPHRLTQNGMCR